MWFELAHFNAFLFRFRNTAQARISSGDQPQVCNPESGTLVLTAFGLPVASSRAKDTSTGQTGKQKLYPIPRPHHILPTLAVDLELSGMPIREAHTSNFR